MSAVREAAANTVFRIANLFEQNCALKHGLPKVGGPDRIDAAPIEKPQPVPPINITNNIPAATAAAAPAADKSPSPGEGAAAVSQPSWLRRAAPFILTAAAGAGIPLVAGLATDNTPPPVVAPTEPTTDGSLLQHLEDQGYHLPGGAPWQTN